MAGRPRTVVWTSLSRDGLDDVLAYIAEDSPEAAEKVLAVVLGVAESLAVFSERGRVVPELHDRSIREVFVYNYRMIYEVLPNEVQILAFIHGARDFDRWLRSLQGSAVQSEAESSALERLPTNATSMTLETTITPVGQFSLLRAAAARFFAKASNEVALQVGNNAWSILPSELRAEALEIAAGLADLATSLGPAIRRSALLSEIDAREAGRAIKGMRAALKFRRFQHWDPSVINDEDVAWASSLGASLTMNHSRRLRPVKCSNTGRRRSTIGSNFWTRTRQDHPS